jgi:integrase
MGEMLALEWKDVDWQKLQLNVRRSDWRGHVTDPKGGRARRVPLTRRLAAALHEYRHLRSDRVLCAVDGSPLTKRVVQRVVERAACRANLTKRGVHVLRHTFCSHLAMRGASPKAIQELAGHRNLEETQRYMHLSPAAVEGAIRLLDSPKTVSGFGDIVETQIGGSAKALD